MIDWKTDMKIMHLPKILQPFYTENIIRLGKNNDGGYLVNSEDVYKTNRLISFGIGGDISFEESFLRMNRCPADLYDDRDFEDQNFLNDNCRVHKATIGDQGIRLTDLLKEDDCNVFLKCDIEGAEYDILDDIIRSSKVFSGFAIEFHDIHQYHRFNLLTNFISKIDQKLVHIHVNTWSYVVDNQNQYIPSVVEMGFSSSSNLRYHKNLMLPHPLDMSNDPDNEDFKLIFE
jgi:hypothetical protein